MRSHPRIGILGGGQLARMLVQAGSRLGLEIGVFSQSDDPAAQVCRSIFAGSLKNLRDLHQFFLKQDLVIFENEFIPCDLLEQAAQGTGARFAPSISAMRFLQDKLNQKAILSRLKIPSSPHLPGDAGIYSPTDGQNSAKSWLDAVLERFPKGAVLKWSQMGYDGKGTFFLMAPGDVQRALIFCNEAVLRGVPLYAEEHVPFKRELALVGCLSANGEFEAYPLVLSEQKNGVCQRVKGPATAFGAPKRLETLARRHAETLARELNLTGVFALEFFETKKGSLLVNEIAPRVHNTGHFTLDAADTDQFENHLRATLGLPLGSTHSEPAFLMLNLLGPDSTLPRQAANPPSDIGRNTHLHWYGKREVAPGRKMGHLNGFATSPSKLRAMSLELESVAEKWSRTVR